MPDQQQPSAKEEEFESLLLHSDNHSDDNVETERLDRSRVSSRCSKRSLVDYAIFAILLSTAIDFILLTILVVSRSWTTDARLASWKAINELPLRSTYLHFDKLYQNASFPRSSLRPIPNLSSAFYQVSGKNGEKNKVVEPWADFQLTRGGMMPSYGRRLIVNSTMSTFAQFYVMDYGFEECSLVMTVQPANETSAVVAASPEKTPSIDVYHFPTITRRMDFKDLTWANRPSKDRVFLYSLPVSYGATHEGARFRCPSMSTQTFEISCEDCNVDVLALQHKRDGLYMKQYQTV